jgi:hypothetical protein
MLAAGRHVENVMMSSRETKADSDAPVLIAGGGMVGLCAAAFLAQRGIRSLAIERLTESSALPRAAFFHMRTLEMFRSLLVRPDGYIAWRSEGGAVEPGTVLRQALARSLGY